MKQEIKDIMDRLLKRHKELGISDQIDYEKSYLYSIITHSTAIEDSTVTEVEAQLLFDEGITAKENCIANIYSKISTNSYGQHLKKWSIKREYSRKWSTNGR